MVQFELKPNVLTDKSFYSLKKLTFVKTWSISLIDHLKGRCCLASVAGAVIQATGRTKLKDGLCAGGQLKA